MLKGSIVALITPFQDENLDEKNYVKLINYHLENGTNGIVPGGTTGESPTLSHNEHKKIIEIAVKECNSKIPVVAGTGSNSTDEAIELSKFAEKAGSDALLIVTPYYNKPTQEGLYQHYKAINDKCGLPIIIYNIPGRSVVDIETPTMAKLAKLKNIIGVKDATGDVSRVSDTRRFCGKDFIQVSGEDASALGFNSHGGTGCISVIANVAPRLSADFQNAMSSGDYKKALMLQDKLLPLHRATFLEPSPCPIKYALSKLGKCQNEVRAPLVTISKETQKVMDQALENANIIS